MTGIGRAQILEMIPHAGEMCLLDELVFWDVASVCCRSRCYASAGNPLRRSSGVLGAACGIEIAAQAMALHGYLCAGEAGAPRAGRLVRLRDVQLLAARLDAGLGDLLVDVERLGGDSAGASYHFRLSAQGDILLSGRATVLLRIDA